MVIEIADLRVKPEQLQEFTNLLNKDAGQFVADAPGYRDHMVLVCRESPGRIILHVEWEKLEDHTVTFRESAAFAAWRAMIGPYLQQPPQVEHFDRADRR